MILCGVYRCRPFKTGVDNLRVMYESTRKRFAHLPLRPEGTLKTLLASSLLTRFLFVHSALFRLALQDRDQLHAEQELVHDELPALLEDLECLLRPGGRQGQSLLPRGAPLHMLAICLFSLHFSGETLASCDSRECAGSGGVRTTTKESLALLVLFGTINK